MRVTIDRMEKIRLIQAGVGGFGRHWIQNVSSRSDAFELVGIADVSQAALHEAGDAIAIPPQRRFVSLEEAIRTVQADAVLTVTPPAVHVEHARLAFAHGLHLMTEKPIADTLANAKAMVEMARQARRQLVVSQNYRFSPAMQKLKRLIQIDRPLGELGHGHIDFYIPPDFTGTFRESMQHVLLVDMAIHHLDLIRSVTGRNIVSVFAQTFRPAWSWYAHNPALKMMLELEGGISFSYSGDWSARGRRTNWNGAWRLQCAQGSIHCGDGAEDRIVVARSERGFEPPVSEETMAIDDLEWTGQRATLYLFAEAIRSGQPAEISGEDNLWSFGAVMAGVKSTVERRRVDVIDLIR
jgi:predicted dehydrogenase